MGVKSVLTAGGRCHTRYDCSARRRNAGEKGTKHGGMENASPRTSGVAALSGLSERGDDSII